MADGRRTRPFFKPGWSPDQLLSHNYVGRLLVVRRSLFEEVGGFRSDEFGSAAEYDFTLRVTERARRIFRLPIVGYHRRAPERPLDPPEATLALEDALRRRGEIGHVGPGLCAETFRVVRPVRGGPLVSVIVPFHNGAEHLRRCLRSLLETAGHEHWEAILVDNRSWDPNTRALLARHESDSRIRVLSYAGRFNWAAINNYAARQSNGAHLLFMNADVEGRSEGWMTAMLEHAQRPEVGAVGARLLYPNGQVQHAGVVMGLGGGVAWHAFCYCPEDRSGYFDQAKVIRNYSAVTGACMMVRYEVFERLGGFGEDLSVAYNDVDFCLRLDDLGYRVVYTPYAELVHDESYTRGRVPPDTYATETMHARWGERIRSDPYFNPNLDLYRPEAVVAGMGGRS
jgi:GT2 family glycosyltransferase